MAPWGTLAFALDWGKPPRLQNTPSFHYVHSCQWRYERGFDEYNSPILTTGAGNGDGRLTRGHTMDLQAKAVRMGWLPFYPQFNENPLDIVREAEEAGAKGDREIIRRVTERLKKGSLRFAVEDPDAPENWPRLWIIWRGNRNNFV